MAKVISKILTKTDVEKRLSFPMRGLESLPSFGLGRAVEFHAMDGNAHPWRFGCTVRKAGHPKPVLSKGWLAFVAHNKLRIGDKVTFYREGVTTGASHYTIKVKKAVKLLGVVVGYRPIAGALEGSPKFYKFM